MEKQTVQQSQQKVDFSNLPQGFLVDEKYRVEHTLIKGSGGSVYLTTE